MTSLFICRGCGTPDAQCLYCTTEPGISSDELPCPKDNIPVWRELMEAEK